MAWLTGWTKRKKITLTGGSSGAQINYQLKLTVTYDSDMQSDFDDLRFTKADGTLIDAWLESKIDNTSAIVWVEFPTTPANTVTEDYYMYYGNSGAASDWNGTATFLQYQGLITSNFIKDISISPDIVFEADITPSGTNDEIHVGLGDTLTTFPDNCVQHQIWTNGNIYARSEKNNIATTTADTPYTTDRRKHKIIWETTQVRFYYNDILFGTYNTNIPIVNLGLFSHFTSNDGTVHWSFIRKYAANPPTYGFGSEESAPSGNSCWYYNLLKRRNS